MGFIFSGKGDENAGNRGEENLAKSLVSLISSITGSKGGATIGSASTDDVTDAIMEQAKVAAGQLEAISKGGSRHEKSNKKP